MKKESYDDYQAKKRAADLAFFGLVLVIFSFIAPLGIFGILLILVSLGLGIYSFTKGNRDWKTWAAMIIPSAVILFWVVIINLLFVSF